MNVNEMTAAECADWCAKGDGWTRVYAEGFTKEDGYECLKWQLRHHQQWDHPYPLTLDGAAAALPDGWTIWDMEQRGKEWVVGAILANHEREIYCEGPDEMTARYRLAVLCRMAAKEHA